MAKIRIAVVDDHEVVCHGLRLSLELEADMVVVGEARTGEEARRLAREAKPDVMLLDVRLEGAEDGPEVCRRVLEVAPRLGVIMLTNYLQDGLVLRSLMAGAKGYVIKDVQLSELKKMIRSVYRGGSVLDPKVTGQVISTATAGEAPALKPGGGRQVAVLSETDLAIVKHLSRGRTNKQIAGEVFLSPHTVKDHLEKIRVALDVGSRTEIVAEALRRGLI